MDGEVVIGLHEIVDQHLPVVRLVELDPADDFHLVHLPGREFLGERRERLRERRGIAAQIDEDEAVPDLAAEGRQRTILMLEAFRLVHQGRGHQRAVERIGPFVVGTGNRAAALRTAAEQHPSVTADGGKRAHFARLAAHDQQRLARDVDAEAVAGMRDFRGAADRDPVAPEDALALEREDLGRGVEGRRQRRSLCERRRNGSLSSLEQGLGFGGHAGQSLFSTVRSKLGGGSTAVNAGAPALRPDALRARSRAQGPG